MPRVSEEHLQARREQIVDAARAVFAERGFAQTSMADLIAESGLSTGAVYRYFDSKDALILAACDRGTEGLERLFATAPSARAALHRILGWIDGPELRFGVQVWAEAMHNPQVAEIVVGAHRALAVRLAAAIDADRASTGAAATLDPDVAAELVLSALGGIRERIALGLSFDVERLQAALDAVLGLAGA